MFLVSNYFGWQHNQTPAAASQQLLVDPPGPTRRGLD
jgi:hypothetical protein